MKIRIKNFEDLSATDLYEILALRTDIFVVEQDCAYREIDYFDQQALHVLGTSEGKLIAYSRILPAGTVYEMPSIGRVAVAKEERSKGYGRKIFEASLEEAKRHFPGATLRIQAQCYLEDFYKSTGFKTVSKPYPDFGIMHVDMILEPR